MTATEDRKWGRLRARRRGARCDGWLSLRDGARWATRRRLPDVWIDLVRGSPHPTAGIPTGPAVIVCGPASATGGGPGHAGREVVRVGLQARPCEHIRD
jgi:hypothetical protein